MPALADLPRLDETRPAGPVDRNAQEDSRRFAWHGTGYARVLITPDRPIDLRREAEGDGSLVLELRVDAAPSGGVHLQMGSGAHTAGVAITAVLAAAAPEQWTTIAVPLRRFAAAGLDPTHVSPVVALATSGTLTLSVSGVRIGVLP